VLAVTFQSTIPIQVSTIPSNFTLLESDISIHDTHTGIDMEEYEDTIYIETFQSTIPIQVSTPLSALEFIWNESISIHDTHTGIDIITLL